MLYFYSDFSHIRVEREKKKSFLGHHWDNQHRSDDVQLTTQLLERVGSWAVNAVVSNIVFAKLHILSQY